MSLPRGRLSCLSAFVQINESSAWDDIEVELCVIVRTVVVDGVV